MQAFLKTGKVSGSSLAGPSSGAKSSTEKFKLPQPWVEK